MIAIPLASMIEWGQEQVVALEPIEDAPRSFPFDGGVAEGAAQAFEDRSSDEERHVGWGDAIEELGSQIVADEAIVAAEGVSGVHVRVHLR